MKKSKLSMTFGVLAAAALLLGGRGAFADETVAWGNNYNGELGNGTTSNSDVPVLVTGMSSEVTAVTAGANCSLAIQNGGLYAWGNNEYGQLGNGTTTSSNTAVAVTGMSSGVTAVAAGGGTHSLAIQNGGLYAWGYNGDGELGNGTTGNSDVPVLVTGMSSGVTAVAAGNAHSLAIQNGGLYAWGSNIYGQLGNGTTGNSDVPVLVTGMSSGVTAVAGGQVHSLAIRNGGLYAWGWNAYGQLGNGTTNNSDVPVLVTGMSSGVTAVAGGLANSLAVKNGNVYAWGYNNDGQLGDGSSGIGVDSPELIDPTDLTNIVAVAAGDNSSYALSSDGSLWVWGYDAYGQLGLGTVTAAFSTPQHLLPPLGYRYTSIAANGTYGYDAVATLAPVPEPSTLVLGGVAGFGLLAYCWRRRQLARRVATAVDTAPAALTFPRLLATEACQRVA
jgi:alpha-tubulin suppressor-like RCC1 family protein